MNDQDKVSKIDSLKLKSIELKKEIDYYNALQNALKLTLNGSYGAFAANYFILFNEHVAGTITAQGRDLTKTMDKANEEYWHNQWHLDSDLHSKLGVFNVSPVIDTQNVSIYADTDSLFVSFQPAISNCTWKNNYLNDSYLESISKKFGIIEHRQSTKTNNPNFVGSVRSILEVDSILDKKPDILIVDGYFAKDKEFNSDDFQKKIKDIELIWNWSCELDFIHGIDHFRYGQYFKDCLKTYAEGFGISNREDFELERISESIINIAKKKYIQHIVYEDGVPYDRLSYLFPKGVELVRSSTPYFAREKIVDVVKYLFANPDTFNIKDLLKVVKDLRREFELSDIDDISMQSSCSGYEIKVLNDKDKLDFVSGTHFAVKASAYYNYLLLRNKEAQQKYEYIKSGAKIKYYYCKNKKMNDIFAYMRGSYPIEFAPEIDYDLQFEKSILSPINSIIEPLSLPVITKRLSVVMDIFGGFS